MFDKFDELGRDPGLVHFFIGVVDNNQMRRFDSFYFCCSVITSRLILIVVVIFLTVFIINIAKLQIGVGLSLARLVVVTFVQQLIDAGNVRDKIRLRLGGDGQLFAVVVVLGQIALQRFLVAR